jgi:tRNA (cmo5U34)-methyltransferase
MRSDAAAQEMLEHFSNPDAVKHYAEGPRRFVPGFADLHRMTSILLAEHAPRDARVLVLGAGGGLELKSLAEAEPGWTFVGVDPAAAMLKLAEQTLGPLGARVQFQHGYIDEAPDGPFDAATCLLTLHFLDADERLRTASEIHRRLKPDAPFVAAHFSFPQQQDERARWLSRYAAYAIASGADPDKAHGARAGIDKHLSLFSPEQDAQILREAGFKRVELFYAAFTWRGWIAYA